MHNSGRIIEILIASASPNGRRLTVAIFCGNQISFTEDLSVTAALTSLWPTMCLSVDSGSTFSPQHVCVGWWRILTEWNTKSAKNGSFPREIMTLGQKSWQFWNTGETYRTESFQIYSGSTGENIPHWILADVLEAQAKHIALNRDIYTGRAGETYRTESWHIYWKGRGNISHWIVTYILEGQGEIYRTESWHIYWKGRGKYIALNPYRYTGSTRKIYRAVLADILEAQGKHIALNR